METVLRVTIIYVGLLLGMRIMGKREFSQLTPLELVTLLLIPELVAHSLLREDYSLTNALIAVSTLFSLVFLTSLLIQRSKLLEEIIADTPTVLVAHGRFIEENLNKERVTPGEIFGAMRKSGLERLAQVKWAVLEGDGKISIVPEENQIQEPHGNQKSKGEDFIV
jgi:uncharacterized membrane protein YcaP (DUF421 family)